jgi:hypothetical protein
MPAVYQPPGSLEELRLWFQKRLEQEGLRIEQVTLSYDGDTLYDVIFYRLQSEAASYWRKTYGFEPTPGQLSRAFFLAEFERFRSRHPPYWRQFRKLKCWLKFLFLSLWGA